jgi:hypothetical protein
MFGVLINVGSSSSKPNGRGRIHKDLSFDYLPIPEKEKTKEKVLTYRELGFAHVKFPDLPVHLDPEFDTYTYGHVTRGFGDIESLLQLKNNGVLLFHATLQREYDWSVYIIGYFKNIEIHDCRKLSVDEIHKIKSKGFENNAHLKRVKPSVDFLFKGGEGSKRLEKAYPLAEDLDPLVLRKSLKDIIRTPTGKAVISGKPWFRWTLTCVDCAELLEMVEAWQKP